MAMGEIGMTPSEFWRLTPAEFSLRVECYRKGEHHAWERTAWLAAAVLNGLVKKKVKPRDLMPTFGKFDKRRTETAPPMSRDELVALARANKEKFWTKISDKVLTE